MFNPPPVGSTDAFLTPHHVERANQTSEDNPGLLRDADLIGQLADPQYKRKISALYQKSRETDQLVNMG